MQLYWYLLRDAADDGERDRAVGAWGDAPAQGVAIKFVVTDYRCVIAVWVSAAVGVESQLVRAGIDAIRAEAAAGGKLRCSVFVEGALFPVFAIELRSHVGEDIDRVMTIGGEDDQAVRGGSIVVGDARAIGQQFIGGDYFPAPGERIVRSRLSAHGGDGQCQGDDERKDASSHVSNVSMVEKLHNLIVFTYNVSGAHMFSAGCEPVADT